jgi:alpha-ketoglutarate-dependent taurine dioxygenase
MKRSLVAALVACAAALTTPFASAADAPPALPAPAQAAPAATAASAALPLEDVEPKPSRFPEPAIKRTVIEDRTARIDELRVRGQLQKVTVSPRGDVPGYEVLIGDSAHSGGEGPGSPRGATGKSVWNFLRF